MVSNCLTKFGFIVHVSVSVGTSEKSNHIKGQVFALSDTQDKLSRVHLPHRTDAQSKDFLSGHSYHYKIIIS